MASFRTSSVFKFTSDYELLVKIIRGGIIPNYCEEDLSFDETKFCVGIPMASFCDIPITLLDEHNSRYGNYGIALTKEWAINNGITPIMYIANDDVLRSVYYHHHRNQEVLDWYERGDVKEKLVKDTILKGFPIADYAEKLGAEKEHAINTHIIGYLKKYVGEYQKKPINNYEENEWRYLVPDEGETKWLWSKEEYMKWRNPHNKDMSKETVRKPAPSQALRRYTLLFETKDVSYILVKDEDFKSRIIKVIKSLKTIGGNQVTDESRKDDLISKILTLEQVKRDF